MGDFFVTVDGPRGEVFRATLGTRDVPVISPRPVPVRLHGVGVEECYLLDLRAITEVQRGNLIAYLAEKFEGSFSDVMEELTRKGLPIRADGCTVTIPNSQKWI